ncbi:MAG: SCO family protein [Pyrinomonadaceae bacterium]
MFRTLYSQHRREAMPARRARRGVAVSALLLCAMSSTTALSQHQHAHEHHPTPPPAARDVNKPEMPAKGSPGVVAVGPARVEIPNVKVSDQRGREVRLYSDLIRGRVVVISFFFTSCTLVCPMQGRALAKLQAQLGPRVGKDVFLISVSKDPQTDTPARLKRWGEEFGVGQGWTLVTGAEGVMKKLVWDFTGEPLGPQLHSPVVLIGNDRTGTWVEAEGLSPAEELIDIIDSISDPAVASGVGRPLKVEPEAELNLPRAVGRGRTPEARLRRHARPDRVVR